MLPGYKLIKLQPGETDGDKCELIVFRHNHAKVGNH